MFRNSATIGAPVVLGGSKVTTATSMFQDSGFDQPVNISFTSALTNVGNMFNNANAFNSPIALGDTSGVTNWGGFLRSASAFNQPLDLDMSSANEIGAFLTRASSFNSPLMLRNMQSVVSLYDVFALAPAFNQEIGYLDTSTSLYMIRTLDGCHSFNQPIGAWDVSSALNMDDLLRSTISFNQSLRKWDPRALKVMQRAFQGASRMAHELSTWNLNSHFTSSNSYRNVLTGTPLARGLHGGFDPGPACRVHRRWGDQLAGWSPLAAFGTSIENPRFTSPTTIDAEWSGWAGDTSGWEMTSSASFGDTWSVLGVFSKGASSLSHAWVAPLPSEEAPATVTIRYPRPASLVAYSTWNSVTFVLSRYMTEWQVLGSADGAEGSWELVDSRTGVVGARGEFGYSAFPPSPPYQYFQLRITANGDRFTFLSHSTSVWHRSVRVQFGSMPPLTHDIFSAI
jgi:hypothetical protein